MDPWRASGHSNAACRGQGGLGSHLVVRQGRLEDPLEGAEQRRLEEHGRHLGLPGDAVQQFGHAVVREHRIPLELLQQQTRGLYGASVDHSVIKKNKNGKDQQMRRFETE